VENFYGGLRGQKKHKRRKNAIGKEDNSGAIIIPMEEEGRASTQLHLEVGKIQLGE